jgi:site-specific recombinase XerD
MLSQIRPKAYPRYLSLPILGSLLEEFTEWSHQQGYALGTIGEQLKGAPQIDRFFQQHGTACLKDLSHNDFDKAWHHYRYRNHGTAGAVRQIERFLREKGILRLALPQPQTPTSSELSRFSEHLRSLRGFEDKTIRSYTRYLKNFLSHIGYDANTKALTTLTSREIEDFLCTWSKRLNRYSLQHIVGYLRTFLRFQYERGVLRSPLHTMIDTPRVYRLEQLPRSLSWETVNAILLSIDRTRAEGIRDYTLLFLMATYGLRSCETVSLTLDDIDWRAGTIRIPQRKTRNPLMLPLTDAAAETLIEYLKKSRPKLSYRELFLRLRAPCGSLKPTAVGEVLRRRIRLSGLDIPFKGSHCIRHSYAVHLLRQGASVKSIGDLLGHRNAESTCVYLRLATEDLRGVALPAPQGVEPDLKINTVNRLRQKVNRKKVIESLSGSSPLRSFLAEEIKAYLQLKRSLGRNYRNEAWTLHSLDDFLVTRHPLSEDLTPEVFNSWCATLHYLNPTVRRRRMHVVRNFCLYRCRSKPRSFVPDPLTFPTSRPASPPYIVSESEMASILRAAQSLRPDHLFPLRPQTIRIALLLLYSTGMRRGELLRLKWEDFDSNQETLLIQSTKFHKSRIIPLSPSVAAELKTYLTLRQKKRLFANPISPIVWNGRHSPQGRSYTGTGFINNWAALCASLKILTLSGRPPRIHDLRHAFAVNVLLRWYQAGEDVQAKLPLLSTYMGHVSVVSTHYYLTFIEGLRSEASTRFYQEFGKLIIPGFSHLEQACLELPKSGGAL